MALEKSIVIDRIEVVESGVVQVRACTRIMEDGVQVSSSFHRHMITPGDDYSQEDARVQAICAAIQTADIIAAFKAKITEDSVQPTV